MTEYPWGQPMTDWHFEQIVKEIGGVYRKAEQAQSNIVATFFLNLLQTVMLGIILWRLYHP